MLQKQTMYGLGRSSSNSTKDLAKGGRKSSSRASQQHLENPFALRDRDLNKSNDKKNCAVTSLERSTKKKAAKGHSAASQNSKQFVSQHDRQASRSSNNARSSPALSQKRNSNPNIGGRASNARSPASTSIQSSAQKTPCISALVQQQQSTHQYNSLVQTQQTLSQNTLATHQTYNLMEHQSAQKSTTRYEMDHNDLMIAEEENDGSSFLQNEREAHKQALEEATDDARSQLSQNLIGAHLITNKDFYPFRAGSAFQTPKPSRDAFNNGVMNSQSPMTSYRNQMHSNIQSTRHEMLQMSQKTTVTNKITANGPQKIGYENDTFFKHMHNNGKTQSKKSAYSPENKENPDQVGGNGTGASTAAAGNLMSYCEKINSSKKPKVSTTSVVVKTQKIEVQTSDGCEFEHFNAENVPQQYSPNRVSIDRQSSPVKKNSSQKAISKKLIPSDNGKTKTAQAQPAPAATQKKYEKPRMANMRIEQLTSLALNVRKQTSPENRSSKKMPHGATFEPEIKLTLVDNTEESECGELLGAARGGSPLRNRNQETENARNHEENDCRQRKQRREDTDEVADRNSKSDAASTPRDIINMEQSAEHPRCLSTIQEVVQSGTGTFCLTVQPTTLHQSTTRHGESYNHDFGTKLIEDNSNLSPESAVNHVQLDPYHPSGDMSGKRFSSMMHERDYNNYSPSNIRLEPVRIEQTTRFDTQTGHTLAPVLSHNDSDRRRESISPVKNSTSPSPQKAAPVEVSVITEEQSLEFMDSGNPVIAQSIFATLKKVECETEITTTAEAQTEATKMTATAKHFAAAQHKHEVCETISAADVSLVIDEHDMSMASALQQDEHLKQQQKRPQSSQAACAARRRRDQRKTPSGRYSVNQLVQNAKQGIDDSKKQPKRSKYNSQATASTLAYKREKQNTSASPLEQPVVSAKTYEDGHLTRQRSSSTNRQQPSALRRSSSTNQSCPTTLTEQIRLANLQKAKQYGNRMSSKNRSGAQSRQASSPVKGHGLRGAGVSPLGQYSPVKPEILQACDLSVSMQPPVTAAFTASSSNFHTQPTTLHNRRGTMGGASSKISSQHSSIKRHKRHEMKLSKPAQQAKIDFVKKTNCAKKIQRQFRAYLLKQAQIERELAEEAARQEQHMIFVNQEATKIQRSFKTFMNRLNVRRAFEKRQRLKMIVSDVVAAWKTRRSLNCLGDEVQEFVNCENEKQRGHLRNSFHILFQKVMEQKLYLEDKNDTLQKLRQQIARQAQQAAQKGRKNQPSNCAKRTRQRNQQVAKSSNTGGGSPFKNSGSPYKTSSPIRSATRLGNVALSNMREEGSFQNAPAPRQHKPAIATYQQQRVGSYNDCRNIRKQQTTSLQRTGSSQRRVLGGVHKNSTSSIASLNRHQQQAVQREQTLDDAAIGNTTVRNSFDNQAINELRNFIQNSDKKNESFCSIQVSKNKLVGGTSHQQSLTNLQRDGSNGKAQQQMNNSQVVVQVHNGSLTDIISPSVQKQSSDAKPVNIMLGSCTRFKDPNSGRNNAFTSAGAGGQAQLVEEECHQPVSHYNNNLMKPQLMTSDTARAKNTASAQQSGVKTEVRPGIAASTSQTRNDLRKTSQESTSEYRQNLKRVRPRVDCWNRSATRGEATPNHRQMTDQMTNVAKDSYRQRGDSGLKTPVHGVTRNAAAHHQQTAPVCSFSTGGALNSTQTQQQLQQSWQGRQNSAGGQGQASGMKTTPTQQNSMQQYQQRRQSAAVNNQHQLHNQQTATQQTAQPGVNDSFTRSRSTNQVSAAGPRRQPSMLREPTKFTNTNGIPRVPGSFNNPAQQHMQDQRSVGASNRIEQLSRPKSSQQVSSTTNSNLRQFITGRPQNTASTRQNNHRNGGYLNVSGSNLGSSRPPTSIPYQPMQTQIFEMRETLANLSQVMEAIAQDAESNQKQMQRDASQGRGGGFGLNSQHRAAMKQLQASERQFASVMETLQAQFASFRDQAVPAGRTPISNNNMADNAETGNNL